MSSRQTVPGEDSMDPQAGSLLARLPVELMNRVSVFLPTADFCSLRLSCRLMERLSFGAFSQTFFSKKQFMFTEPSLAVLIQISTHRELGPVLRHVCLGLDRFVWTKEQEARLSSLQNRAVYIRGAEEQMIFFTTGEARHLLAAAFRSLPNLETVDIRDMSSGERRSRDGMAAPRWASYGSTTILREIGTRLDVNLQNDHGYLKVCFDITLAALADAGARPARLELVMGRTRHGIPSSCFAIPPWLEPSLTPVLNSLQRLHIWLFADPRVSPHPRSGMQCLDLSVKIFLAHAHNLKWFRLNFSSIHGDDFARQSFLRWLALPVPDGFVDASSTVPMPTDQDIISRYTHGYQPRLIPVIPEVPLVAFSRLERLDLGMVPVIPNDLISLVKKFAPSLVSLSLWNVQIMVTHPMPRLKPTEWIALLPRLTTAAPRLRHLVLHSIMINSRRVRFPPDLGDTANQPPKPGAASGLDPPEREFRWEHRGIALPQVLDELCGRMEVHISQPRPPAVQDDDDDDNAGEGEGEGEDEDEDEDMGVDGSESGGSVMGIGQIIVP